MNLPDDTWSDPVYENIMKAFGKALAKKVEDDLHALFSPEELARAKETAPVGSGCANRPSDYTHLENHIRSFHDALAEWLRWHSDFNPEGMTTESLVLQAYKILEERDLLK